MRVLLASFGSYGDLNPYLGLGLALKARGHQPVLAVMPSYRGHVEDAGLEFRPLRPDGNPSDKALVARIMDPMRGAEFLIRDLMMPHLREMYDDLTEAARDADLLVSHPLTFAAPVLCEQRGLPWASSVLAPLSFFSALDPPLAVPQPVIAALHRRWRGVSTPLNAIGQRMTRSWAEPVQALRASLGLPRARNPVTGGQFSPHLTLALFSRVLAVPQADWPPHTVVTGAVSYDAVHGPMRDDLARFLDDGPAPIVFTLGSSAVSASRAKQFYEASAAAATALGRRAVLLVGRAPENRPATVGREVFVTDWAPHSELFHRAAAVVHQGGAGTLHTALAAGRPMLVVPFAHDQPDNGARVERLGVARVLYPQHYSPARVRRALDRLLSDPVVTGTADALGALVRAEDGGAAATRALTQLHDKSI